MATGAQRRRRIRRRRAHGHRALRRHGRARPVADGLETGEAQEAAAVDVDASGVVRAAGGIVRRAGGADGEALVLLVHRPRYDDWTFPKGKNESGERDEDAALREVEEETGLRCELGDPAG